MSVIKDVINSIQDSTFNCIKNLNYSNDNLLDVFRKYEDKIIVSKDKSICNILYETGLVTEEIKELEYGNAFNLQLMELLFLFSFKKIIDCYGITQDIFDKVYDQSSGWFCVVPSNDNEYDVASFIMSMYSVFYDATINKNSFTEALVNIHRFYISFKR